MTQREALRVLLAAHDGRVKYRGSKFGDALRAALCRADVIKMDGDFMVLTETGRTIAERSAL